MMQLAGQFEIVAINAEWDTAPAQVAGYCNQTPPVRYPFLQDMPAAGIHAAYEAVKHDLFVLGRDGALRASFTGKKGNRLSLLSPASISTLRDALLGAAR